MATFLVVVQIMSGMLTLVIAGIVSWIAYQQWKTARDKVKLDLFDRRYQVYRGLMDLFAAVAANTTVSHEDLGKFYQKTDQKRFLFNDDICDYLKEVRERAVELRHTNRLIAAVATRNGSESIAEERVEKVAEADTAILKWFGDQIEQAGKRFEAYLGFKKAL